MLKSRVYTAFVLLALFFVVLFALPYLGFVVALVLVFSVAAWEWARLAGFEQQRQRVVYALLMLLLMSCSFFFKPQAWLDSAWMRVFFSLACIGWLLALFCVCVYPRKKSWNKRMVLAFVGVWLLLPAWMGLLLLKNVAPHGELVLLVIVSVVCADSGAYFIGKRFGKKKLAVQVSPGKTWAGFWGGLLASALLAFCVSAYLQLSVAAALGFIVTMMLVAAASVLGDLFESMLKRERGIKDSSHLLPGHGGVLDRIDGWMAAIPFFTLMLLELQVSL